MGSVCLCLSPSVSVCLCRSLSVSVCLCLSLSVSACLCLSLSVSVFLCLSLPVAFCLYLFLCLSAVCELPWTCPGVHCKFRIGRLASFRCGPTECRGSQWRHAMSGLLWTCDTGPSQHGVKFQKVV